MIADFGEQSGLSIVIADPSLARQKSPGVSGKFTARQALRRLLKGTSASFAFVNPRTVRVFLQSAPRASARPAATGPAAPHYEPPVAPPLEIVVTASKQSTPLDRYAGSVDIVGFDGGTNARLASQGTSAIISRLPAINSTNLGPGRNKLFIRGVADSSFSGPSQSTVGQYLGDIRLTYNAPDPDLNLYDISRVEMLAGPQGTLYGTGTLGGIIRLVPNMPSASRFEGTSSIGIGATQDGAMSSDGAVMLNLPLATDRLAVRAVGYRTINGGYIQNRELGMDNINRTFIYGGRLAIRYTPGNNWTIDLGGMTQNIANRDGQYTTRGERDLARNSAFPQPFDNDYGFASLGISKQWGNSALVSSTVWVRQNLETVYDATNSVAPSAPRLFDEAIDISLLSHETRLSGRDGEQDWVIGFSLIADSEKKRRRLGDPAEPASLPGIRNEVTEAAVFGQYGFPVSSRLSATLGARLTYSGASGMLLDALVSENSEPERELWRLTPSFALTWSASDRLTVFAHYQQGVRAGGLAVNTDGDGTAAQRFESDTLQTVELGFRLGQHGRDRLAASAALFYTRWTDIQADLIDDSGLPYTDNIGDGEIGGLDGKLSWMPISDLNFEISAFLNSSTLTAVAPAFVAVKERDLPNVAKAGGRVAAAYRMAIASLGDLVVDGSVRYVGASQLGFGPPLDVEQGKYFETALGARLDLGSIGVSLDISNLANSRANRFAFGNPFGLADRNQETPLRPRSIRIGIDARF